MSYAEVDALFRTHRVAPELFAEKVRAALVAAAGAFAVRKTTPVVCLIQHLFQHLALHACGPQAPELLSSSDLMVRCAGAIYPWSAAATFVLGAMVFGTCWQHLLPPGTPHWSSPEALQAAAAQQQGGRAAQINSALGSAQGQGSAAGGSGGPEEQKKVRWFELGAVQLMRHRHPLGMTYPDAIKNLT
jgi:hypothetical protein